MAPSVGLRAAQLQAATRDCVSLLRVIIAASVKLVCKLACTALAALMLAAAATAAAAGAVGRRASRQPPQPAEQQRLAAVSQLAAEEEEQGEAAPDSPLSPPSTPVDLVAVAAAAAAAKQQVSPQTVVELLDPDRPRLLNRIPSGTHRARRAPDIITPSMASLQRCAWSVQQIAAARACGACAACAGHQASCSSTAASLPLRCADEDVQHAVAARHTCHRRSRTAARAVAAWGGSGA